MYHAIECANAVVWVHMLQVQQKPTHVATSVVEPTHIATSVIKLVHVVASASCIWCKLMASIVGPSWCWQFEVTSKTKASRWIFHPQGYKIGILQRLCA